VPAITSIAAEVYKGKGQAVRPWLAPAVSGQSEVDAPLKGKDGQFVDGSRPPFHVNPRSMRRWTESAVHVESKAAETTGIENRVVRTRANPAGLDRPTKRDQAARFQFNVKKT